MASPAIVFSLYILYKYSVVHLIQALLIQTGDYGPWETCYIYNLYLRQIDN